MNYEFSGFSFLSLLHFDQNNTTQDGGTCNTQHFIRLLCGWTAADIRFVVSWSAAAIKNLSCQCIIIITTYVLLQINAYQHNIYLQILNKCLFPMSTIVTISCSCLLCHMQMFVFTYMLFPSAPSHIHSIKNLGFLQVCEQWQMARRLCVFLVAAQDLCDVSSTGRRCQGTSCCVAEADICRSKLPWPEFTFHRGTQRAGDGDSLVMWPGEHTPLSVPIYSLV